jgi:hypothetical protein
MRRGAHPTIPNLVRGRARLSRGGSSVGRVGVPGCRSARHRSCHETAPSSSEAQPPGGPARAVTPAFRHASASSSVREPCCPRILRLFGPVCVTVVCTTRPEPVVPHVPGAARGTSRALCTPGPWPSSQSRFRCRASTVRVLNPPRGTGTWPGRRKPTGLRSGDIRRRHRRHRRHRRPHGRPSRQSDHGLLNDHGRYKERREQTKGPRSIRPGAFDH